MSLLQDNNNSPITKLKDMEFCDLADKEFKIAVLRKFCELQENTERQSNKTRKTIHEKNKVNKKIAII